MLRVFSLLLLITLSVRLVASQDSAATTGWTVSGYTGLAMGHAHWVFVPYGDSYPNHPHPAFGLGLGSGPILTIAGVRVEPSVELSYGSVGTGEVIIKQFAGITNFPAHMSMKQVPIVAWVTFTSETKLSPFARAGAGAVHTDFEEVYSTQYLGSIYVHRWAFACGIGGGFRYEASRRLDVTVFLEDWIIPGDLLAPAPDGREYGLPGPTVLATVGVKGTIKL